MSTSSGGPTSRCPAGTGRRWRRRTGTAPWLSVTRSSPISGAEALWGSRPSWSFRSIRKRKSRSCSRGFWSGRSCGGTGTVNGKIKISGIAADSGNTGSDLKSISYVIKNSATQTVVENFNNVEIPLNESWSFELATTKLSAGNSGEASFDIFVSAQDKVDNVAVTQKTIVIDQQKDQPVFDVSNADKTVAAVSSLSSSTNMFPSTAGNKLYGSVKDDDGLGSLVVTCKKVGPGTSGTPATLTPAKALVSGTKLYDFEYTLPSVEGQYEISVEAKDIYAVASASDSSKKETNYDSLAQKFYVTIDDGAPVFSAVTPVLNESTWLMGSKTGDVKTLTVHGTVSDGNGLASEGGFVTTHTSNLTATPASVTAKSFIDEITLPSTSGKYTAEYKAKDIYGQESEYKIEYSVDVDNPVIDGVIKVGTNNVAQGSNAIDGYITDNNIAVELNVVDNESGIKKYVIYRSLKQNIFSRSCKLYADDSFCWYRN